VVEFLIFSQTFSLPIGLRLSRPTVPPFFRSWLLPVFFYVNNKYRYVNRRILFIRGLSALSWPKKSMAFPFFFFSSRVPCASLIGCSYESAQGCAPNVFSPPSPTRLRFYSPAPYRCPPLLNARQVYIPRVIPPCGAENFCLFVPVTSSFLPLEVPLHPVSF